ncbi:MAG: asparaginase [Candidatus Muirbacterium halophilum]|nr:asparaginase [Candidatus Muirbacterium halophilum]
MKKKVLLILTGGTITMHKRADNSLDVQEGMPNELKSILNNIKDRISVDVESLYNIDSTDVTIECWKKIALCIYENYESYDGFVVSHGTDTMAFSASAVSFILRNIAKPVVFTGAQLPLSNVYTDGTNNIINSLLLASDYDIAEVVILFGEKIIRATRARKVSAFDLKAFESINSEPLGSIGLSFKISDNAKGRRKQTRIKYEDNFDENIIFVKMIPGLKPEVLRDMCKNKSGIILQGFGAGNIPTRFFDVIKEFSENNIPVVVTTQCMVGKIELELYKVGKKLSSFRVISAYDMTPEAATVKLMWALGKTKEISKIKEYFDRDLVGELS